MNQKVRIGQGGAIVTLTDKNYVAAGGEASIYVNSGTAFKVYHDAKKKMLPAKKMTELALISNSHVIVPKSPLYDATTGDAIGYTTNFVDDAYPLLKFFTKTFKDENSVNPKMIAELVKAMQLTASDVHKASCLIVDFNELNVLVKINSTLEPWFIDTDSYATPSFKATAIMDSVRDRRVTHMKGGIMHYEPDLYSDWFSWGILAFWLYTNIHPFRGAHSNYKPRDKGKQMDDGISVFHKGVRVPPTVNDFSVIPKRHLDWFKSVFLNSERSIPPLPDSTAPIAVPTQIVVIHGNARIAVTEVAAYPDQIVHVFHLVGNNYVVTRSKVFMGKKELRAVPKCRKYLLSAATDGTIVAAALSGVTVQFTEMLTGKEVGTAHSADIFARNGCVYTVASGKLVENSFSAMNNRIYHRISEIENVSNLTAKIYDGCIIQDLLGKKYLTIPYAKGKSFSKYIPQLDGFRVMDAKSDKTVTVVIAEQKGVYHRFIIIFDSKYDDFEVREVADVAYDAINFTVVGGLCLLLASPTELELFVNAKTVDTLSDPPFDATMPLFSTPDGAFFINSNSIHHIQSK